MVNRFFQIFNRVIRFPSLWSGLLLFIIFPFLLSCSKPFTSDEWDPNDTDPPGIPQGFRVENDDDALIFYWAKGVERDLNGYRLYYSKTPGIYTHFREVGLVTQYEFHDLENNIPYYFTLRAYDKNVNLSGFSTQLIETPVDIRPPDSVTEFRLKEIAVSSQNYSIDLSWKNPKNRDFKGIRLIRKTGNSPSSQNDGQAIASGNIESFQDKTVTPGVIYYYRIYTYDEIPNYSLKAPSLSGIIVP